MIEGALLQFGYPLRLMSVKAAALALSLCGVETRQERTLLTVAEGGRSFAVTDACGGIEHLLALVAVGFAFSLVMQKGAFARALHVLAVLPALVASNAIRIAATVLLFGSFGEGVLGNAWHSGLGYAQTVLSVVFIWLAGLAVRAATAKDGGEEGK